MRGGRTHSSGVLRDACVQQCSAASPTSQPRSWCAPADPLMHAPSSTVFLVRHSCWQPVHTSPRLCTLQVDGRVTSGPDLSIEVNGLKLPNPFVIGSGAQQKHLLLRVRHRTACISVAPFEEIQSDCWLQPLVFPRTHIQPVSPQGRQAPTMQ